MNERAGVASCWQSGRLLDDGHVIVPSLVFGGRIFTLLCSWLHLWSELFYRLCLFRSATGDLVVSHGKVRAFCYYSEALHLVWQRSQFLQPAPHVLIRPTFPTTTRPFHGRSSVRDNFDLYVSGRLLLGRAPVLVSTCLNISGRWFLYDNKNGVATAVVDTAGRERKYQYRASIWAHMGPRNLSRSTRPIHILLGTPPCRSIF